jgi:hypothetical protein
MRGVYVFGNSKGSDVVMYVMLCATVSALLLQLKFQMLVHCTFCTVSETQMLSCYALLPQCLQVQMLFMLCTFTAFSIVSGSLMLYSYATLSAVSDAPMLCTIVRCCGVPFYDSVCSFQTS